jgi:plastocyanin
MAILSRRSLALLAVGAVLRPSPGRAQQAAVVAIDNFVFTPAKLTIKPGATVTWTNDDDIPHTIVAKERQFRSKALDTGDSFSFTFSEPGRFDYFCGLHPHMVGSILVAT